MIYTLPYQTEDLFKPGFLKLRDQIDVQKDAIHITVTHRHLDERTDEDFYKLALKLDGQYRTRNGKWKSAPVKIRVISQM